MLYLGRDRERQRAKGKDAKRSVAATDGHTAPRTSTPLPRERECPRVGETETRETTRATPKQSTAENDHNAKEEGGFEGRPEGSAISPDSTMCRGWMESPSSTLFHSHAARESFGWNAGGNGAANPLSHPENVN